MMRERVLREQRACAMAHLGGCDGPLQADHIIPLSMGGTRGIENYQVLCRKHNISKGGANRRK
jgi:5-methylcytosine-specific restriction endonuclease McrA